MKAMSSAQAAANAIRRALGAKSLTRAPTPTDSPGPVMGDMLRQLGDLAYLSPDAVPGAALAYVVAQPRLTGPVRYQALTHERGSWNQGGKALPQGIEDYLKQCRQTRTEVYALLWPADAAQMDADDRADVDTRPPPSTSSSHSSLAALQAQVDALQKQVLQLMEENQGLRKRARATAGDQQLTPKPATRPRRNSEPITH